MQPHNDRRSAAGFTLLEVLLALMLFALSAVVLGAAYLNVINGYGLVRQNEALEEDLRFVRSMILQQPELEEIERGGEIESPYLGRVVWRAYLDLTPTPELFLVTLEMDYRGNEFEAARQVTQQFYLLRPSWADPADRDRIRQDMDQRFQNLKEYRMR